VKSYTFVPVDELTADQLDTAEKSRFGQHFWDETGREWIKVHCWLLWYGDRDYSINERLENGWYGVPAVAPATRIVVHKGERLKIRGIEVVK
jgi:hypothetical protein